MRTPAHVLDYYADQDADTHALNGDPHQDAEICIEQPSPRERLEHMKARRRLDAPGHDHNESESLS